MNAIGERIRTMASEITNYDDTIDSRDVIDRFEELQSRRDDESAEHRMVNSTFGSLVYCEVCGHGGCEDITGGALDDDEEAERIALCELVRQGETLEDWHHGVMLVRDSYFREYAIDVAIDTSGIEVGPRYNSHHASYGDITSVWPFSHIDWDAAADELQTDYTDLDFNGVTYWAR